jgi:hypothetical protein
MSMKPLKRTGFNQSVLAQSSTQKEELGALRILRDGRKFRYAKAGASALAAGKLTVSAAVGADVMNEVCTAVHAIGDVVFSETITSATYIENYFAGGYLQVNDGTGEGHQYKILSSTAVTAGTAMILQLDEPIRVATAGTSATEFSIIHSPWQATVESTTLGCPVGVTPIVVTATYFYWAQTGGPAIALSGNTDAAGKPLYQSTTTAGALAGLDAASYYPQVAIALGTAGVSGEYKPVMLTMD